MRHPGNARNGVDSAGATPITGLRPIRKGTINDDRTK